MSKKRTNNKPQGNSWGSTFWLVQIAAWALFLVVGIRVMLAIWRYFE